MTRQVMLAIKAEELANEVHLKQEYGNQPYSEHLEDVSSKTVWLLEENAVSLLVNDSAIGFKALQVAWLHDAIEDTDLTEEALRERGFAEDVIEAILLVTKEEGYNYEEYIERIKNNFLALVVKLADTIVNLSFSLVNHDERRIAKYLKQYDLLNPAFREAIKSAEITYG